MALAGASAAEELVFELATHPVSESAVSAAEAVAMVPGAIMIPSIDATVRAA
jgi:hypothetical protein